MPRKIKTEAEKASTPLSEEFFQQPLLIESLEHLIAIVMSHGKFDSSSGRMDRRLAQAAIYQSIKFQMADEFQSHLDEMETEIRARFAQEAL